jgi:DNA-binding response OmpR family regulator
VFLDLVMQNVGGFAVLSSLQAWDMDFPVIVLSAISQREAIVKAFQAGVKSYLIKPLKPSQVMKKAAEILRANF